ncbi:MAG TPA: hypothetical protein VF598_03960 [Hymenobacter sp.]|jgi:hypothetical protein
MQLEEGFISGKAEEQRQQKLREGFGLPANAIDIVLTSSLRQSKFGIHYENSLKWKLFIEKTRRNPRTGLDELVIEKPAFERSLEPSNAPLTDRYQ